MKRLPLHARDGSVRAYALVDDEDFELVSSSRWCMDSDGYAIGSVGGRMERLHRVVMGRQRGDGLEIDHVNRDRLDCRRENLRVTTRAGNAQNLAARGGSSRFRGVAWYKPRSCWQAFVTVGGRMRKLGYRKDEIEAAKLAEAARRELMPFAEPDPELEAALA